MNMLHRWMEVIWGGYNLLFNNCLHYTHKLINLANLDNELLEFHSILSISIIPCCYQRMMTKVQMCVEMAVNSITERRCVNL